MCAHPVVLSTWAQRDMYRRLGQAHIFTDALMGTYDEFRAEVA